MRSVLASLLEEPTEENDVVVDMEAGLEHLSRGTTRHVDTMLAVAEPYFRSMETAKRVYELARELDIPRVMLVGNKVRDDVEHNALAEFAARHRLQIGTEIPFDERISAGDLQGRPHDVIATGGSHAMRRIAAFVDGLLDNGAKS